VQRPKPVQRPAAAPADGKRARLIEIIAARSLLRGASIRLASGASSSFYFDMKRTSFDPEGASLIADLLLETVGAEPVDYVGGLEMGAVPLVACLCQRSYPERPLGGFFVRKQAKDHGTQRVIEGLAEGESLSDRAVVLVEDVTTTGGSVLQAVDAVVAEGGKVNRVVTVVDRLQGAADNLAGRGIRLASLLTAHDFAL